MEIYKLGIEDIKRYESSLLKMLQQSFEKSFPRDACEFASLNDKVESLIGYIKEDKATVLGVIKDNNLIGFIWFFEKSGKSKRTFHINHFVVDEEYRRLGIGKHLLNEVEKYAEQQGINELELLVTKDNDAAVSFYEKNNFEIERLVMKKRLHI